MLPVVHTYNKPSINQLDQRTIYKLIEKYRDNTASEAEKQALLDWYRQTAYQNSEFPEDEDAVGEFMLARLNREINPNSGGVLYIKKWLIAASVLVFLGAGLLYVMHHESHINNIAAAHKKDILPGGNKAILTLADGSKISLTDVGKGKIARQNGIEVTKTVNGQLVYVIKDKSGSGASASDNPGNIPAYNTITTPKGGQYQVTLPDGSKVWLNSISSIKFPVNFSSLKERRVELTGEAYFEVAHNKALPFRVTTGKQVVEVLGTHFNINAYRDEPNTKATLLEGSVKVTDGNNTAILKPGQQAELAGNINISEANVDEIVAWKNGYFRFEDKKLEDIMRVIARWYDIKVVFLDESVKNETYGALSTRFDNISALLNIMQQTGDAKFSIEGSTVRISRKKQE
jgi:ferric-dicitrate binding protein FerR (iron transport regulator)